MLWGAAPSAVEAGWPPLPETKQGPDTLKLYLAVGILPLSSHRVGKTETGLTGLPGPAAQPHPSPSLARSWSPQCRKPCWRRQLLRKRHYDESLKLYFVFRHMEAFLPPEAATSSVFIQGVSCWEASPGRCAPGGEMGFFLNVEERKVT